jgi:hypothetical protein
MKNIPLSRNLFAQVDDEDFERLNQHKWSAHEGCNTFYAKRNVYSPDGKQETILMHREILGIYDKSIDTDHQDHNGLNNQKYNLLACTRQRNQWNRINQKGSRSSFKGVCFHKRRQKWQAAITVNGKHKHLGYFYSEMEAATAYDLAALEYHREYGHMQLNVLIYLSESSLSSILHR